tara:strand:+ start:225 stop:575 length:351 start_codon:yes stop_codon:yes gene_type:complete
MLGKASIQKTPNRKLMELNLQKYLTNNKSDPNQRILMIKSSISGSAGRINGSAIMESINIFDLSLWAVIRLYIYTIPTIININIIVSSVAPLNILNNGAWELILGTSNVFLQIKEE